MDPTVADYVLRITKGEMLALRGPHVEVQPIAFAELGTVWDAARTALTNGQADGAFGQRFFAALPHALRQGLLQAAEHRQIGRPPRLLVMGDPTTRAQFLPWEALCFGAQEYPQARGRLRIVRWPKSESLGVRPERGPDRWRVLVLVGDVRQAWGVLAAEPALAAALKQIAESLRGQVDLQIAAPRWLVARHAGLPWIPFDGLDDLAVLLSQPWVVVHFLGHSDGQEPASAMDTFAGYSGVAKHLLFQLDPAPESSPAEWPITTLQQSLSRATRVLVLGACLTQEHLAAPLLEIVDHVVGNQAMVSPQVAADFCRPFYTALAELQPVSSALAAAHAALFQSHPHAFWIPVLWTRNLDDQPLLNPEDLALRAYSDSVVRDMSVLSGPLTTGLSYDDILSNIYVDLEVLPDEQGQLRRAQVDKDSPDGSHGQGGHWPHDTRPTLEDVVRQRQVGWFSGRYYLFGHAADGKTTALRHLGRTLAKERPLDLLPFYTTLQQVVDALRPNLGALTGEQVLQHVLRPVQEAPTRLQALRSQGRLLVLLDSLDEVADADREAGRHVIDALDQALGQNVLVVASRSIGFVGRCESRFRAVVLQGILPEDRDRLVGNWCAILWRDRENFAGLRRQPSAEQFANRLLAQIHRSPGLRHATTNPLTVALLVRLAAETEPEPGQEIAHLPRRREVIYRACIRFLLGSRHRRKEPVPDGALDAGLTWLRRLALWLHEQGRSTVQKPSELQRGLGQRDVVGDLFASWDLQTLVVPGAPWSDVASFRAWLQSPAGLFVDKGGGAFGFAPKVFQDALAAEALVEQHPELSKLIAHVSGQFELPPFVSSALPVQGDRFVAITDASLYEQYPDERERVAYVRGQLECRVLLMPFQDDRFIVFPDPRKKLQLWGETLTLVTSQLPKDFQRPWLEWLQAFNRALALRALAGAELDVGIVRGFFAWGEDAGERRKVIEELGEVEDNDLLRSLLETLAGCTTDGEDLWHLDDLWRSPENRGRRLGGLGGAGIDARLLAMSRPDPETYRGHFRRIPTPKEFFGDRDWFEMGSRPSWEDLQFPGLVESMTPHQVVLTQPFYLGHTPVTVAQYLEFDPAHVQWCFGRGAMRPARELAGELPVTNVSWYEAEMFARWLELHRRNAPAAWKEILPEGFRCQLPTEAQWEWAARGGKATRFWSGDQEEDLARVAWYGGNSGGRTHRVGEKPGNLWGLHDVHGNVWEWCQDSQRHYGSERVSDPHGDKRIFIASRVLRGGLYSADAAGCRSAYRAGAPKNWANENYGFRLALSAPKLEDR